MLTFEQFVGDESLLMLTVSRQRYSHGMVFIPTRQIDTYAPEHSVSCGDVFADST